jgi:(E)-4-hydroxy-3-methylbut-2-enyl-diphosphate synthase
MFTRKTTHPVQIGPLTIGHCDQVMIQSMTNTKTADVIKTIKQIKTLVSLGCKLVRVAIVDQKDIQGLKQIVQKKICPIVADIHYDYHLALAAIATGVAKIRINPNNITSTAKLKAIVLAAKKHHTAIRLGINQGSMIGGVKTSLSAIVQYAINIIKQFERWGFKQIVVSLKTSDPLKTQQLYFLAAKKIKYPLHLGVTEAGNQNRAIIKSVIGLTPLIQAGIGDTIRISITNNPLSEPVVAKHLLGTLGLYQDYVNVISCPTCGRLQ